MLSKYKLGWIGLRCERANGVKLKKIGFIDIGRVNNKNGFDYIKPVVNKNDFAEKCRGLPVNGTAIWFSDAQWGKNRSITDKQWQSRIILENI